MFIPRMPEEPNVYDSFPAKLLPFKPEVIITEDSNSGFQFFSKVARNIGIECVSAGGKSNIDSMIENYGDKKMVIIADGAAFGPDMRMLAQRQKLSHNKMAIYLPESFEWIILKSGLVCDPEWENIAIPEKYIETGSLMQDMYSLTGSKGVAIWENRLEIDLDEIRQAIEEFDKL